MIEKLADAFAELERQEYKVTSVLMNQETLDWFLLIRPEFAEEIWGAEIVVYPFKDNRVHLEGRFTGSFGPYRATRRFQWNGNYSSVSSLST